MSKYEQIISHRVPIEDDNPSIKCDDTKCKKCKMCQRTCQNDQAVFGHYDLTKNGDRVVCINCGQCTKACPFGALTEVDDTDEVRVAVEDPEKIVVFSIAPAVRVALGELFKLPAGTNVEGKFVSASRSLGADYVFDVTFGADLTIMEEAHELVERVKNGGRLPMFTSCCPAWVRWCEIYHPELIPNLSSAMSPIAMQNVMIKTYFAKERGLDPKKIVTVTVTPCTAKKAERLRPALHKVAAYYQDDAINDGDIVITTREFGRMIASAGIDFTTLPDGKFDALLSKGSSAGLIFGATGGVMEAALRTGYYFLNGKNPEAANFVSYEQVRGLEGVKSAIVDLGVVRLKVCVVTKTANAAKVIEAIEEGSAHYDFIEVMACNGGCIGGGGQPKVLIPKLRLAALAARNDALFAEDKAAKLRLCHENPEIKKIYADFLGAPGSTKAHELIHQSFTDLSSLLKNPND